MKLKNNIQKPSNFSQKKNEPHKSSKIDFTKTPRTYFFTVLFFTIFFITSCEEFVQMDAPSTQLVKSNVFDYDETAIAATVGIYSGMWTIAYTPALLTGLSSDELIDYSSDQDLNQFYTNSLLPSNSMNANFWNTLYQVIYRANSVLEGLQNSNTISSSIKNQLTGEAKVIRAFCYFYLSNLYGDIPLITTTSYQTNAVMPRHPKSEVTQQIISDLHEAETLLSNNYVSSTNAITDERIRPNTWVAKALLARVYLYQNDWINAELYSSSIIENSSQFKLSSDLNTVFLKNSTEAIWQVMPSLPGYNTWEGYQFIPTSTPNQSALNKKLLNAFEPTDGRFLSWVGNIVVGEDTFYFPLKYKINLYNEPLVEYSIVFRLAEQYLIRAESRAQKQDLIGAKSDINTIRSRSGLGNTAAQTKEELLDAIMLERQVELFTEWGHRWLDLKRSGRIDDLLQSMKEPNWESTDILYPIPQSDRENNRNLDQNLGY